MYICLLVERPTSQHIVYQDTTDGFMSPSRVYSVPSIEDSHFKDSCRNDPWFCKGVEAVSVGGMAGFAGSQAFSSSFLKFFLSTHEKDS